jgi:hypothetical protein
MTSRIAGVRRESGGPPRMSDRPARSKFATNRLDDLVREVTEATLSNFCD